MTTYNFEFLLPLLFIHQAEDFLLHALFRSCLHHKVTALEVHFKFLIFNCYNPLCLLPFNIFNNLFF